MQKTIEWQTRTVASALVILATEELNPATLREALADAMREVYEAQKGEEADAAAVVVNHEDPLIGALLTLKARAEAAADRYPAFAAELAARASEVLKGIVRDVTDPLARDMRKASRDTDIAAAMKDIAASARKLGINPETLGLVAPVRQAGVLRSQAVYSVNGADTSEYLSRILSRHTRGEGGSLTGGRLTVPEFEAKYNVSRVGEWRVTLQDGTVIECRLADNDEVEAIARANDEE